MGSPRCVDCKAGRNLAEQFDARHNAMVWRCAHCHYEAVRRGDA